MGFVLLLGLTFGCGRETERRIDIEQSVSEPADQKGRSWDEPLDQETAGHSGAEQRSEQHQPE